MQGNSNSQDGGRSATPQPDPARVRSSTGAAPQTTRGPGEGPRGPLPSAGPEPTIPARAPREGDPARNLNLVGSSELSRAVAEAVRRGLSKQFVFQEAQLESAVKAIGRELMLRLKANSKSVRSLPKDAFLREVRADRQRIEAAREAARKELEAMLVKLKNVHDQVNLREAELVRESQASGQIEDKELAARISEIFESLGSGPEAEAICEKITAVALSSLQSERDRSIEAQMSEHRGEVEQFERRIAKLTQSLELTEEELKRIAAAKNIDIGVESFYRTVQGLSASDDDYETKKELMSCIFAANFELQKGRAGAS